MFQSLVFIFGGFGVVSIRRTTELTSTRGVNGIGYSLLSSVCLQSRTHAPSDKMVLFGNVRKMTNEINLHMTPDNVCADAWVCVCVSVATNKHRLRLWNAAKCAQCAYRRYFRGLASLAQLLPPVSCSSFHFYQTMNT